MSTVEKKYQLLELPANTRKALITLFFMGLILIVAASMFQGDVNHVPKDKIIHFCAYTLLSVAVTLGFPFRYTIIGLLGLALASYTVEFIQPWNDRSKDFFDAWANTAGICVGSGIGFLSRLLVNFLWTEYQEIRLQRYIKVFQVGDVILGAGQKSEYFYIIKKGSVNISHNENGDNINIGTLSTGSVFGLISEVMKTKQEETIIAKEECEVYELDYDSLVLEAGGKDQPLAILIKALVKQYNQKIDHLVEKITEQDSSIVSVQQRTS